LYGIGNGVECYLLAEPGLSTAMLTDQTGAMHCGVDMTYNSEIMDVLRVLTSCLARLDALDAQVPAVHLETCVSELEKSVILD
jgi:hypothetical protein